MARLCRKTACGSDGWIEVVLEVCGSDWKRRDTAVGTDGRVSMAVGIVLMRDPEVDVWWIAKYCDYMKLCFAVCAKNYVRGPWIASDEALTFTALLKSHGPCEAQWRRAHGAPK